MKTIGIFVFVLNKRTTGNVYKSDQLFQKGRYKTGVRSYDCVVCCEGLMEPNLINALKFS